MQRFAALIACSLFLATAACADEAGWTSLFDGKTLAGWKSYSGKPIGSQWVVEDGAIHLAAGGGGDIVTEKEFRNFEFQFQWKVAPGANSGVMYRVRPGDKAPYFSGPEYQVLDDSRHRDGGNPKTSAAALYGLIAGSKFKDWTQYAGSPQGMICLQDHGDKVWFRDLKIRDLKAD